jgi:hypothetical protein
MDLVETENLAIKVDPPLYFTLWQTDGKMIDAV